MDELKKTLEAVMKKGLQEVVFPGAAVGIIHGKGKRRKLFTSVYGLASIYPQKRVLKEGFFFDLASLTKPLGTTLSILSLIKEEKISLQSTIYSVLDVPDDKADISIEQLLGHSSGLPAYRPYYEKLIKHPQNTRRECLKSLVLNEPLVSKPGDTTCYSDLGFMVLGWIVEKISGASLDSFISEKVMKPIGLDAGLFFPVSKEQKDNKNYVATENCPWRNETIIGEVHDDNCWAVGGICGHAGLFGNIKSVLAICGALLDQYHERSEHPNYRNDDLKKCLLRQREESSWGLGFDTPSKKDSSSGRYFSNKSFGHLGFTGTSFWIDPLNELVVVLLTNRVHPDRKNDKIKKFRPFFHDSIRESLHLI